MFLQCLTPGLKRHKNRVGINTHPILKYQYLLSTGSDFTSSTAWVVEHAPAMTIKLNATTILMLLDIFVSYVTAL